MNFLKKMMLAASLFLVSGFASAAVYDLDLTTGSNNTMVGSDLAGGLFVDYFDFTLDGDSLVDQDLASLGSFSLFSFSIFEAGNAANVFGAATTIGGVLSIDDLFLQAGHYTTAVMGVFDGGYGGYSLATSISPVPEASTIAMMLGGLGLVGFMARRRKAA